jgi:hypothetical protein
MARKQFERMAKSDSHRITFDGIEYRVERKRVFRFLWWTWTWWSPLCLFGNEGGRIPLLFISIDEAEKAMKRAVLRTEADRRGFRPLEEISK